MRVKDAAPNRDVRTLFWLHVSLTLLVPVFVMALVGCQKELKATPPTLGPQVDAASVQKAIDDAVAENPPENGKVGDWVHYETNYRIENAETQITYEMVEEVIGKQDLGDKLRFLIHEQTIDRTSSKPQVVDKEVDLDVDKTQPPAPSPAPLPSNFTPKEFGVESQSLTLNPLRWFSSFLPLSLQTPSEVAIFDANTDVKKTTYHGLQVKQYQMDAPGDCSHLPKCKIAVTEIDVAIAEWTSDTQYNKTKWMIRLSPDTPYLGNIVDFCQEGKTLFQGHNIFVNQCQRLDEYGFGSP